jgi:hypothetical protein
MQGSNSVSRVFGLSQQLVNSKVPILPVKRRTGATTGAKQTKGSEHIGQESITGDGMSQYFYQS